MNISVFEPQQIGGKWVEPLCLPVKEEIISRSVSASINLLWFSLNIANHQKQEKECGRLGLMVKAILCCEHGGINIADDEELKEALDRVDELCDTQADENYDSDFDDDDSDPNG